MGNALPKAGIGDLFGRQRALRLPPLARGLASVQISERALRNLITVLIIVFLVMLGIALVLQLSVSRQRHLVENNRLSTLYLTMAASELSGHPRDGDGRRPDMRRAPPEDLKQVLPPEATQAGRSFAIIDADGMVSAAWPGSPRRGRDGRSPTSSGPTCSPNAGRSRANRAGGRRGGVRAPAVAVAGAGQRHGDPSARCDAGGVAVRRGADRGAVHRHAGVLVLLGMAFHWQAARAAEADRTLALATGRLDKALDRGRCGLWDWDIARGRIFWSRSMFDILGLEPQGDFLTYGAVARRLHPDDPRLDEIVDTMLKGGRPAIDQEFRMRHANGDWVWLRARCELSEAPGEQAPAPRRHRHRHHRAEARRPDEPGGRDPPQGRDRDHLGSVRAVGRRQPARHLQFQVPAVPFPAGQRLPAACTPYEEVARAAKEPLVRQRMPVAGGDPLEGADVRGAARGRPLAADQRAAHQGRRLRVGRHRHHRAEEARGAPARFASAS